MKRITIIGASVAAGVVIFSSVLYARSVYYMVKRDRFRRHVRAENLADGIQTCYLLFYFKRLLSFFESS